MRTTAILSLLLLVLVPACRTTRLVDPDPVSLQGRGETARDVIADSLRAQSWVISQEEPGMIHAIRLVNNRHEIQVLVSYDRDSVRIEYKGSKNLKYSKGLFGGESIHKNYKVWTGALRWEIQQRLSSPGS